MGKASTEQENFRKAFTKAVLNNQFNEDQLKTLLVDFISGATFGDMNSALESIEITEWDSDL